jgi:O-antigen ligase
LIWYGGGPSVYGTLATKQTTPDVEAATVMAQEQTSVLRYAIQVALLAIACWLPVPVTAAFGARAGWPLAIATGVGVGLATKQWQMTSLFGGLLVASAMIPTGLVTAASEYMPVAVVGLPLVGRWVMSLLGRRTWPVLPPRSVQLALAMYLVWAVLAGIASIDRRLSATYVLGMMVAIGIAFVIAPAVLREESDRRRILGVVAGMAIIAAVSNYLLWVVGPLRAFGRPLGDYLPTQLTFAGRPTGLHIARVAGIFLAPGSETIVLVAGLTALLALRSAMSGGRRTIASAGVLFFTLTLLTMQTRDGWFMGAVATGGFVVAIWWLKGRVERLALVVSIVLAVTLLLVLSNTVGSITTVSAAAQLEPTGAVVSDDTSGAVSVRGGASLSGRLPLWKASASAIQARPVFGWGPGNDAIAIQPRLTGANSVYRGLSSHSTWFRTGVEMGVPGLLALGAILVAVATAAARRLPVALRGDLDLTIIAFSVIVIALTLGQFFETYLLGGVTFHSFYWTLGLGLLATGMRMTEGSVPV